MEQGVVEGEENVHVMQPSGGYAENLCREFIQKAIRFHRSGFFALEWTPHGRLKWGMMCKLFQKLCNLSPAW